MPAVFDRPIPGVPVIVSFGRTGSGKSWMGNQLTAPGTFAEGDGLESETTTISHAVAWNNDLYCDVPGYFDSRGNDERQQQNFVDALKDMNVRVLLFIFTGRLDFFTQKALEAFAEYKANILLICNQDPPRHNRGADITRYEGYPLLYIGLEQTNLEVLKRYIDSMTPTVFANPVSPVSLFKDPLEISHVDVVRVFKLNERRDVKETVSKTTRTNQKWPETKRDGGIGRLTGGTHVFWHDNWIESTTTEDIMVSRLFAVYDVVKMTYAVRKYENSVGLYAKEIIETVSERIE